jgi:hypothetical protein
MVKEDCFAYKGIKCDALHKLYCEEEGKCSFYKTKKQLKEEQEKIKIGSKKCIANIYQKV